MIPISDKLRAEQMLDYFVLRLSEAFKEAEDGDTAPEGHAEAPSNDDRRGRDGCRDHGEALHSEALPIKGPLGCSDAALGAPVPLRPETEGRGREDEQAQEEKGKEGPTINKKG